MILETVLGMVTFQETIASHPYKGWASQQSSLPM